MNSRIKHFGQTKQNTSLPRGGLLKIGKLAEVSRRDGNGTVLIPQSIDYFRPTGDFSGLFKQVYGPEPKSVDIAFYSDDMNDVAFQRMRLLTNQGKVYAQGDGHTFLHWDLKTKSRITTHVDNQAAQTQLMNRLLKESLSEKGWEIQTTIRFVLLKLSQVLCSWEFTTPSEISGNNIMNSIDTIAQATDGVIKGIPATLKVDKHIVQSDMNGRSFPIVSLFFNVGRESILQLAEYVKTSPMSASLTILNESRINQLTGRETVDHAPDYEREFQIETSKSAISLDDAIGKIEKIMYVKVSDALAVKLDASDSLSGFYASCRHLHKEERFTLALKARRETLNSTKT